MTACQEDPAKQGGTYTAARHMNTGSNIPQARDINNANSVYKPAAGSESVGGTPSNPRGN